SGDSRYWWAVHAWRDSAFGDSIVSQQEMGQIGPQLATGTDGDRSLLSVSRQTDVNGYYRLALWPLDAQVAPPETVAVTTPQLSEFAFSAALAPRRRWVARIDQPPGQTFQVRTYLSDATRQWQAVAAQGSDEYNCAITPLGDTTALLVYTGFQGAWWTLLDGAQWA